MGGEQVLSAPKQIWMICQTLIQASVVPATLLFLPVSPSDPRSVETLQSIANDNRRFLLAAGSRLNRFTGHDELGPTGPYALLVSDLPWIRTGCKLTVSSVSWMILFAKQQRGGAVLLHLLLFHVCWNTLAIYIMFFRGIYCIFKRDGACLAISIF